MFFENPMKSYSRKQTIEEPDIEMGITPIKKPHLCWGEISKKPVIIPTVKPEKNYQNVVIKDIESKTVLAIKKVNSTSVSQPGNSRIDFV